MKFLNYLITDPKYYSDDLKVFVKVLNDSLVKHDISIACFRDKVSKDTKILAQNFLSICRDNNIEKIMINSNIDLALSLGFDGIHLSSKQFDKIAFSKENGLYVIISCHDFLEVEKAYDLGADAITYSPIFYTPYKGKPKGVEALNALKKTIDGFKKREFKLIGLGGVIDENQVKKIKESGADGFAAIRYFVD